MSTIRTVGVVIKFDAKNRPRDLTICVWKDIKKKARTEGR